MKLKEYLKFFRLNWDYEEDDDISSTSFVRDTRKDDFLAGTFVQVLKGSEGYYITLNGDTLSDIYDTSLDAKIDLEQQLSEIYPNYGPPRS